MTQIPDSTIERLASYLAERSGYNPNEIEVGQWGPIRDQYRETAKRYLRVAMGSSPEFDLPNEVTYNSETSEIKGLDGNWYFVEEAVLIRYMSAVGFAGANLTQFGDTMLNMEQLGRLCAKLYPGTYELLDDKGKHSACEAVRKMINEARNE